MPTIICFIDGVAVDRVVGFEDMGNKDEFPTLLLSRRLIRSGAMKALTSQEKGLINLNKGGKKRNNQEDSDDNEDY